MKHKIKKYCNDCEKEVVLRTGFCPKCFDFLFDVTDTPEEFTYTKRSGDEYYKLMINEGIVPNGFMGVRVEWKGGKQ
jgi:hypothetical protein|tara:strand:+ start:475 stop:705 length:231 start_codon:yes stop_codon:yes gene_type:complete